MKYFSSIVIVLLFANCVDPKLPADLLITNANIYTVNESFDTAASFVVKDGLIIEIGEDNALASKYTAANTYDAAGKTIVPGLIDAHGHLYNLGVSMQLLDLVGTTSFKQVLEKTVAFQKEKQLDFIVGRGWDQNDWRNKPFQTIKCWINYFQRYQ